MKAQPVNEPLGAILLVAPPKIADLVQEAQQALADLSGAVEGGGWDAAVVKWKDVRNRLINAMRSDSGARPFPGKYFAERD